MSPSATELHVVFGAGPLGRAVAGELAEQGKRVRLVNRSGNLDAPPAGVEVAAGDAYDAQAVHQLAQGAAAVYQCAQPSYTDWPEEFPPLQAAILEGTTRSGAKLVIAENLYMYGAAGEPMSEETPFAPNTKKGRTRAAMSEAALDAHRSGTVRVALARGSDFFGPWVLGSAAGDRFFYPALAGKAAQTAGNLDVPHTFTYIRDFARAMAVLGARAEALGQAWHVPNDRPAITQRQFAELAFAAMGLPVKLNTMGRSMMRLGGLFIPEAREMVEIMYQFEQPFQVDSSKFERTFGLRATPLPEALCETVAWFKVHPPNSGH